MTQAFARDLSAFVGRDAELAELHARFDDARAGRGGVVLLAGEPGIGKTRLVEELAATLPAGAATVLWGRCYENDGAPAYWPWIQVLRSLLRTLGPEEARAALGAGAADIGRIVPEAGLPGVGAGEAALDGEQGRFRLFDSVTNFLLAVARAGVGVGAHGRAPLQEPEAAGDGRSDSRVLLLVLDDLHWADASSLLLLQFLAREVAAAPVLLIGTYRDAEVTQGDPLARTLASLARLRHAQQRTLVGLDEAALAGLIGATLGASPPADLLRRVQSETQGNPLFVAEVLRLLAVERGAGASSPLLPSATRLPQTVRETIARRLERLSEGCQRTLTLAAVLGHEFGVETLSRLSEAEGGGVLAALEEAETGRLIAPVPLPADAGWDGFSGRYAFAHATIRETLYGELPTARRLRLHRRVAESLEALYAANPEPHLAELAYHFLRATPDVDPERALHYTVRAAERARQTYAHEESARLFATALRLHESRAAPDEEQTCRLLLDLAHAQEQAGDGQGALASYGRAAELARDLYARAARQLPGQPTAVPAHLLARAGLGIGAMSITGGRQRELVISLLEEALIALGDEDSAERAMALSRLAQELYFGTERERADALSRESVAVARRVGRPEALFDTLYARGYFLAGPDHLDERRALIGEMLSLAERRRDDEMLLRAMRWQMVDLVERGELEVADEVSARYGLRAEQTRQPFYRWQAGLFRGMRTLLSGRLDEAEALAWRTRELRRTARDPDTLAIFGMQLFVIRREQGRAGELEGDLRGIVELVPTVAAWRAALATMYCEMGREAEARVEFERVVSGFLAGGTRDGSWLSLSAYVALVCWYLEDAPRAAALYEVLQPYEDRFPVQSGAVVCMGSMAHFLGLLAATIAAGDPARPELWERAARHFETGIERNTRIGARGLVAHSRLALAGTLLRRHRFGAPVSDGDRLLDEARRLLDDARATATELGMARLEAESARLRAEADAVTTKAAAALPNGLTEREVEILKLLAAGRTNAEIAAELVLSAGTVKRHAENIYTKIGAHRRADATAYALRHGLLDR